VGSLSALLALKKKYDLPWIIVQADQSGKMQMERVTHDGSAMFLITANAPFFMMGEGKGLEYRFIGPVHAEDQVILRRKGISKKTIPDVVVYTQSSAYEQILNMQSKRVQSPIWGERFPWPEDLLNMITSAHIEPVDTLEELVDHAIRLEAGDFVVAWTPLTDGLRLRQPQLVQVGSEFKHWISLYARHDCMNLADEFLWLFGYEFQTCDRFRDWSREVLLADEDFWHYIGGGAGIED